MAELPHLGKHCAHRECNRLDYLSIGCTGCSEAFCKEHFPFDDHKCSRKYLKAVAKKQYVGVKGYSCCYSACSNRELTEIVCDHCGENFCLEHRHQVDHDCAALVPAQDRMTKTRDHVQKIMQEKGAAGKAKKGQGHKSKALAAKVALMKIKQKAMGDKSIPEIERIYINVILPSNGKQDQKPVFFSKEWTIGRIVDDIASRCKLSNKNNVSTAKKLKLFDPDATGPFLFDKRAVELLDNNEIFSGSTLNLDYVENEVSENCI